MKVRLKEHRSLNDRERAVFYSSWLYSAMRLYASTEQGKTLPDFIKRFGVSRERALEILDFLCSCKLCSENDGVYTMGDQHTHLDSRSPFLPKHHTNWRVRAIARSDTIGEDELMFTSPLSISRQDFAKVREALVGIIQSTSKIIAASPAEEIACLNVDLFWMNT